MICAKAPPIVIPAESASTPDVALSANIRFLSLTVNSVELIVVVVPSTCKSP